MTYPTDGLTEDQLRVLKSSGAVIKPWAFYLAGGTALSLYLKHRRSVDLDWFTQGRLEDPMALAQKLRDSGISFSTTETAPGTLHGTIQGVRVSFFEHRYALLQPLNDWPKFDILLASLDDLAAMKLSAIAQRGSKKDFLDVYALCRGHRPLQELLSDYQRKFGVEDIGPVLYGLVYFEDADEEPNPVTLWEVSWSEVKNEIRSWVKEISV
jgi:hypothetical protein